MLEALNDWNVWWRDKELIKPLVGKERLPLSALEGFLKFREIKFITGVRRSGKSTLFYQIIDRLLLKGINADKILLINFEDEVLSKHAIKEIFDIYQSNIYSNKDFYLFIDEVHRCKEWELFVRKIYDTKNAKQIFITDSSSKFIAKEYARTFTGRNIKFILYPLSFKEYVLWKLGKYEIKKLSGSDVNSMRKLLNGYIEHGGFPEVCLKEESLKKLLLKEYFDDILYKDVIERFNVDISKSKELALFLLSNIAKHFSVRNYSRQKNLSYESIEKYLSCFEEVFLLFKVPKFSYSLKAQETSPKKVYIIDHGLANVSGFKFSQDIGRIYENMVYVELKRRLSKLDEIYYWNNKFECDFLIKHGTKMNSAIQVCYNIDENNINREINGLMEAMNEFKLNSGTIVTRDLEETRMIKNKKIMLVPLWKYLLEDSTSKNI